MSLSDVLKISPSSLSLYLECPRCFWLLFNKGIRRPATPFSTLPSGVDYTLKVYFDHWREGDGTPPMLKNKLPGRLLSDKALISRFRSRSFGYFDKEANAYFNGMLDDAVELDGGFVVPLDNKTKGFPPGVKNAWLLIKHDDQYSKSGYDAKDFDFSAKSKKSLQEIKGSLQ